MSSNAPTPSEYSEQPWATRLPGESQRWFERASLYFGLGTMRSIRAVYNAELAKRGKSADRNRGVPSSWSKATKRFDWLARAAKFDEWRRKEVFSAGNAQDTERIKKLDELIEKLCALIMGFLERIDPEKAKISAEDLTRLTTQLLSAIDLMVKHTGGYAQRIEHTGKDGGKIEVEETKLNVFWYMPKVEDVTDDGADVTLGDVPDAGEAEQGDTPQ